MRMAIVGAGAIDIWLGVRLANAGQEVSVLARGETLAAVRQQGLRLVMGGATRTATCPITGSGEDRMAVTRKLGAFKTSMLQDAGRSLEIDALVGAPREIGRMVGVETPNMDALHGLIRLFARRRSAV